MVEHDGHVGQLLDQLDDLKIADNTIVLYTTDNGAEIALWPDGAMTMFRGEKGTTWEGGFRIPMMVRWPGVIKPGTVYNDIISLIDWFPTLLAAAGVPDVKETDGKGFTAGKQEVQGAPRWLQLHALLPGRRRRQGRARPIYYFDQGGNLNAFRCTGLESQLRGQHGATSRRLRATSPAWAMITNLRMDPYERGFEEGGGAMEFVGQQMWLLVPVQAKIKEFFADFDRLSVSGRQFAQCRWHRLSRCCGQRTP